nr:outer membrane protein transport protein [uncultured Pedobacter sp.]
MKLEKIILLAVTLTASTSTYAQYSADALRFSRFENSVDARFGAMGGTKAAVGGDLSSLYGNPAGIGMFSKSEFSLTPELSLNNNKVNAFGTSSKANQNYLDFGNVGAVFHSRTYKTGNTKTGLLSLNFGVGYQKTGSYKDDFSYSGVTNGNNLGDNFAQKSNADTDGGVPAAPQTLYSNTSYGANRANLTYYNGTNYFPITSAASDQKYNVKRTGGSSEVDFSLGLNVSNKLFLGVGLGLASFNYSSIENVNEVGVDSIPGSGNKTNYDVDYTKNFDTQGSGVNLKIGAILKPTNELRIGLSLETPTWYSVTDNYSENFRSNLQSVNETDSYPFEYNLRTPLKLNGGLAYFIGSRGFISADVGFVNYSNIKFSSSDNTVDNNTKRDINNFYKNVVNYSIGGEFKLDKSFLLRAGFHSTGNPYQGKSDKDYTVNSISGGLGYRFGNYYLDAALINSNSTQLYSNYDLTAGNQPIATIDTRTNQIALTFGVRF